MSRVRDFHLNNNLLCMPCNDSTLSATGPNYDAATVASAAGPNGDTNTSNSDVVGATGLNCDATIAAATGPNCDATTVAGAIGPDCDAESLSGSDFDCFFFWIF